VVTLVFLAKRRTGMDAHEFHQHWRQRHGPLVARRLGHHLVSYQQLHRHEAVGADRGGYDGAAILRFRSMEDFHAFLADPAYTDEVGPDEETFIDRQASAMVFCDDPVTFVGEAP
jgi:uncharacterized protein (TIGR02118 family)